MTKRKPTILQATKWQHTMRIALQRGAHEPVYLHDVTSMQYTTATLLGDMLTRLELAQRVDAGDKWQIRTTELGRTFARVVNNGKLTDTLYWFEYPVFMVWMLESQTMRAKPHASTLVNNAIYDVLVPYVRHSGALHVDEYPHKFNLPEYIANSAYANVLWHLGISDEWLSNTSWRGLHVPIPHNYFQVVNSIMARYDVSRAEAVRMCIRHTAETLGIGNDTE